MTEQLTIKDHPCNCATCTNKSCPVFGREPPITEEMIRKSKIADEVDKARALIFMDSTGWIGCMFHPLALQVLAGPVIAELNKREHNIGMHPCALESGRIGGYNEAIKLLKEGVH